MSIRVKSRFDPFLFSKLAKLNMLRMTPFISHPELQHQVVHCNGLLPGPVYLGLFGEYCLFRSGKPELHILIGHAELLSKGFWMPRWTDARFCP